MKEMGRQLRRRKLAASALVATSIFVCSIQRAVASDLPTAGEVAYEAVSAEVRDVLEQSNTANVVFIADETARKSEPFQQLRAVVRTMGPDVFAGRLTGSQISDLGSVDGVRIDLNSKIFVESDPLGKKTDPVLPLIQPSPIWDTVVAVPDTDPDLITTQSSLGVNGAGAVVAVLDTGVDDQAVGLENQVIHRVDFSPPTSSCSDNGEPDPVGHGTHVASIVAGRSGTYSTRDVRGVAPGAKIVDVRVFNCGSETTEAALLAAMNWVVTNKTTYGINIVNMSLGSSGSLQDGRDSMSIMVNRMVANGLFLAVAAGNDGDTPGTIGSPGVAQFATTVGAASVSKYGAYQAFYSSVGPTGDGRFGIDLIAPGSSIEAAQTTARYGATTVKSGTSMATPYVAGIAALLIEQDPNASPGGTLCELSESCPIGVLPESMVNPIQNQMKTSDWYAPGTDNMTGSGLVSASATMLGQQPAPAVALSGTFRGDSPNVFRVAPHSRPAVLSVYTPTSVRSDAFDSSTLNIQIVDQNFELKTSEVPCTLLGIGSCSTAAFTFTPYLYAYLLRPSTTDTFVVVNSPKNLDYEIVVPGLDASVTSFTGVSANNIDLSTTNAADITLSRTTASAIPTSYFVSAPASLQVQNSAQLPAGPPGTSVNITVSKSGVAGNSEERIVISGGDGSLLVSSVIVSDTGDGRIIYPNPAGYSDRGESADQYYIANDGTILLNSRATGLQSSNGYDSVAVIAAGSRRIKQIPLTQTSPSQIDIRSISLDGKAFVGFQFPGGAGLLPGDSDTRENYFVHNITTGATIEVGPDNTQWNMFQQFNNNASYRINNDGTEVAWSTVYPSGTSPVKLGWQGGSNFATTRILAAFPSTTRMHVWSFSGDHIVVRITDASQGVDEFRDYSTDGTFRTLDFGGVTPTLGGTAVSALGSATAIINGNSEKIMCDHLGRRVEFENSFALELGMSRGELSAVADDCSWVNLVWTSDHEIPRGVNGTRLLKLSSDGTFVELDATSPSRPLGWLSNTAGTHFVRVSATQLGPGDTNGAYDYYRGLGSTPGLTPTFSSAVQTADGFTVQISNYNASFTWVGTNSAAGVVVISSSGLVTVTGVAPGVSSTVTITTSRAGSTSGSATSSSTFSLSVASFSLSVARIYSVKAGEVAVKSTLLTQAKLKAPTGSKYALSVAVSSKKICKILGTAIKTLKKGTCAVKVTVTLKGKKPTAKTVKISVK